MATPTLEGHTEEDDPTKDPKTDKINFVTLTLKKKIWKRVVTNIRYSPEVK